MKFALNVSDIELGNIPETLPIELLNTWDTTHYPDNLCYKNLYEIGLLSSFISDKDKEVFLHKRPDEDLTTYEYRLRVSPETSKLGSLIQEISNKFNQSPQIIVDANAPIGIKKQLENLVEIFTNNTDMQSPQIGDFVVSLTTKLLTFGRVFFLFDAVENTPYIRLLEPHQINYYSDDMMVFFEPSRPSLFSDNNGNNVVNVTLHVCTKTQHLIYKGAALQVHGKQNGRYYYQQTNQNNRQQSNLRIDESSSITNNKSFGFVSIPNSKSLGIEGLSVAKSLYRSNSYKECAESNLYIQRVLVPESSEDILSRPFDDSLDSDNTTIIKASDFKFSESSGSAIQTLSNSIKDYESKLDSLVGLNTSNNSKVQSGQAKIVDLSRHIEYLISLSELVKSSLETIYNTLVTWVLNQDEWFITIDGLDNFSNEQKQAQASFTDYLLNSPMSGYVPDEVKSLISERIFRGFLSDIPEQKLDELFSQKIESKQPIDNISEQLPTELDL